MTGNDKIIVALNTLLTHELTAVDQYFLQGRMLEKWGFIRLHERISHEADDERRHADMIVKRILFLEGQPDVASRAKLSIGSDPKEMLENDLAYELEVARHLNDALALCQEYGDNTTRELLEELLRDTEQDHILWLRRQLYLIETVGLEQYLCEQL
jgi:bacterioferritin